MILQTHQSIDIHSAVESLRPSCWRCEDNGYVEGRHIVPRFLPCVCEIGQSEIEGRGYHKRHQSNRFARAAA